MNEKIINLTKRIKKLVKLPEHLERYEMLVSPAHLSPVDRYIASAMASSRHAIYDVSYAHWRVKRISKMLEIYGQDWFEGKRILELGAGLCEIGAFFADLGAHVTCVEGREATASLARLKHRKVERLSIKVFDLEEDFTALGQFDLIIHFGLLYHIPEVETHIKRCFELADEMVLETVVCDSDDPYLVVKVQEEADVIEEALNGMGSRPTAACIERIATENEFVSTMYATADLNVRNVVDTKDHYCYDWPAKGDGDLGAWRKRRFWRMSRKRDSDAVSPPLAQAIA